MTSMASRFRRGVVDGGVAVPKMRRTGRKSWVWGSFRFSFSPRWVELPLQRKAGREAAAGGRVREGPGSRPCAGLGCGVPVCTHDVNVGWSLPPRGRDEFRG